MRSGSSPPNPRVVELERLLALAQHPEGGLFHEHHRGASDESTAIYFLLRATEHAAWHRLARKDEVWHHYEGDLVELHLVHPSERRHERLLLGPAAAEVRPSRVVPAGVWQAARVVPDGAHGYALAGATVAPGFHFEDWTLADGAVLESLASGLSAEARELICSLASA